MTASGDVIRPGQVWSDTRGRPIQVHGGSIFHEDGVFYWYGENKERTTGGTGIWHWGIRCYRSCDLVNWEDLGLIIPPDEDDPDSPLHPTQMVDRPHIVHNRSTGAYVCWLKVMGRDGSQRCTVLQSDSLLGPYRIVRSGLAPLGMDAGDFDLVVDPDDGRAYYYFERVHDALVCVELTDDYTDVTDVHSIHFLRGAPPDVREAPAHFERDGKHYLITSGTTSYYPNRSEVAVASGYHGPFEVLGDPHPGDPSGTSFRSQISSVFRHPGKADLYIALGDRWLPHLSPEESDATEVFRRVFSDAGSSPADLEVLAAVVDPPTASATHVWLPIRFDGDQPVIDWLDEWSPADWPEARGSGR